MAMWREALMICLLALCCAGMPAFAQPFPGKGFPPDKGRPLGANKQGEMERMRDAPGPARPVQDRLSPDERRQLRRDIDQHGRELYRGKNR
ncbi:MAG: hypothetical protein EXR28_10870 [Betaproteobacteria bacterium]|nr:hypothetical protein [Betaproteobacteria bacterium]